MPEYIVDDVLVEDARAYIEAGPSAAARSTEIISCLARAYTADRADLLTRRDIIELLRANDGADLSAALTERFRITDEELEPRVTFEVPQSVADELRDLAESDHLRADDLGRVLDVVRRAVGGA